MHELELRVKQQSVEVEKGNALRQKVTQEKAQLEIHIASISGELQEANRRCVKHGGRKAVCGKGESSSAKNIYIRNHQITELYISYR